MVPRALSCDRARRDQLYSAWDQTVGVVDSTVLACTVEATSGLDVTTGAMKWSVPGSAMYAPPLVLTDGTVVFIQEKGRTLRVRSVDGSIGWKAQIPFTVLNGTR